MTRRNGIAVLMGVELILNAANLNWPGILFYSPGQLFQQTQTIDQYDADIFIGTDNVNITNTNAVTRIDMIIVRTVNDLSLTFFLNFLAF